MGRKEMPSCTMKAPGSCATWLRLWMTSRPRDRLWFLRWSSHVPQSILFWCVAHALGGRSLQSTYKCSQAVLSCYWLLPLSVTPRRSIVDMHFGEETSFALLLWLLFPHPERSNMQTELHHLTLPNRVCFQIGMCLHTHKCRCV